MIETFKDKQIDEIRLNFSDPWPKKRHEKRRLTSKQFLKFYSNILKDKGKIIFKTDNLDLFNYSLDSFKENGWELLVINNDYPLTHNQYDVPTEYEIKFRNEGIKINYLEARKGDLK